MLLISSLCYKYYLRKLNFAKDFFVKIQSMCIFKHMILHSVLISIYKLEKRFSVGFHKYFLNVKLAQSLQLIGYNILR